MTRLGLLLLGLALLVPSLRSGAHAETPDSRTAPVDDFQAVLDRVRSKDRDGALDLALSRLAAHPGDAALADMAGALAAGLARGDEALALAKEIEAAGDTGCSALLRGSLAYYARDPDGALEPLRAAVRGFAAQGRPRDLQVAQVRLGAALSQVRRYGEARAPLEAAWAAAPELGRVHYRIEAGDVLTRVLVRLGRVERADSTATELVALASETEDPLLGRALNNLAYTKSRIGHFAAARDRYRDAAGMALADGDTLVSIRRSAGAAEMAERLGDFEGAMALYRASREHAKELGSAAVEISVLVPMAVALRRHGDPSGSVALCDTLLALAGSAGVEGHDVFRAHGVRGNALFDLGRLREARKAFETAQSLAAPDRPLDLAANLNNQGNVALALGDVDGALRRYLRARKIGHGRADPARVAIYSANIASCYERLGRYQEAIEMLTEASAAFAGAGDYVNYSHSLLDRALLLENLGHDGAAQRLLEDSIRLLDARGIRSRLAGCRIALAGVYQRRGEFNRARAELESALRVAGPAGSTEETLRALVALTGLELAQGRTAAARDWAEQGMATARSSEVRDVTAQCANRLGDIARREGNDEEAVRWYGDALEASRSAANLAQEITAHIGLARSLRAGLGTGSTGDAATARARSLQEYRRAVVGIERLRTGVGAEAERWSVFGSYAAAYSEAAALLAETAADGGAAGTVEEHGAVSGRAVAGGPEDETAAAEGLALAEAGRARTFLDRLRDARVDPDQRVPADLREERNENLGRRDFVHRRLIDAMKRGDQSAADRLTAELDELDDEYARIEGRIGASRATFAGLRGFRAVPPVELGKALPEGSLLLEYVETDNGYHAFRVTPDGRVRGFALPGVSPGDVERFRAQLEAGRSPPAFDEAACNALGRKLFEGLVAPALDPTERLPSLLVVVPDGALWSIPFEAMVIESNEEGGPRFLFETTAVAYEPSATALMGLRPRSPGPILGDGARCLVVADPAYPRQVEGEPASGVMAAGAPGRRAQRYNFAGLPFTREEADAIAACLGKDRVTLLTGAGATEKRFDGEPLASYRIIHLAAHSVIDERHPQISAVVLALDDDSREDGFLTIRELYGLELDADLVVLSACRSSGGEAVRGEGPVALARPFLTAGASAAVVTLWPVSDRSTAAFMAAFYRGLARGLDPVAALAGARRALLASDRPAWRLPFHWAPFVLVGRY